MTAVCGTFNPEQLLVVCAAGNKTEFHTIIDEAVAKNAFSIIGRSKGCRLEIMVV